VKRDDTVDQLNKLVKLCEIIKPDSDQATLFRIRLRDLDNLLVNFRVDQDNILVQLIILFLDDEFAKSHAPIE